MRIVWRGALMMIGDRSRERGEAYLGQLGERGNK